MLKALGGADAAALERELALRAFSVDYARSSDAEARRTRRWWRARTAWLTLWGA